ncbi:hypothetical protein D8674_019480 [Pyrus ussuriensis x Pyrus communis]|uniref:Uncharacterized protein n=1 Tax=Pyrus ussuriensis x Pyrus communis TaxID=2448454 RepID=A0A5N5G852_9ROSA|nr:hypothetical protein D8674_019480 [Pyrus ussuriensis x Pyrus communis]
MGINLKNYNLRILQIRRRKLTNASTMFDEFASGLATGVPIALAPKRVSDGVTEVGKGYVVACLCGPVVRSSAKENARSKEFGQHDALECPKLIA